MNQDLQNLTELLQLEIPPEIEHDEGFLEVIGKSHHETINSNVYRFFLDQERCPDYAPLFINALLAIISEKTGGDFEIGGY